MSTRTVFLFSGQGTQYHQMGRWLREHDATFRDVLLDLDAVVRAERGDSVLERVHGSGRIEEPLDDFRFTHPGLFMVQYAAARMLMDRGFRPDVVLGASLGELIAAAVAGVMDPHDCLILLLRQVELFERSCPPGGMLAVLAGGALYHDDPILRRAHLAAINSAGNFVLAGTTTDLDTIEEALSSRDVLCQRLAVPYAFHSPLIDPVRHGFAGLAAGLRLRPARVPVVSATTGAVIDRPDPAHLWRVLRDPFDADRTLAGLLRTDGDLCLDLGPSGTLANLVNARLPAGAGSRALPLMSPFARDGVLLDRVMAHRPSTPPRTGKRQMKDRTLRVHAFPGQGSQVKGMGRELFDRFPKLTEQADEILGYSIRTLCVQDPDRKLRSTEYTQPALYIVNAFTHLAALQEGIQLPDYLLGHSLGEYVALFAAGAFDFETGLRLVQRRGALMSRATGGTMAAVSGLPVERVRELLDERGFDAVDIANMNTPSQIVLAGPKAAIDAATPVFVGAGARCAPLNVSAPFHSRYMAEAAEEFAGFLDEFGFAAPKLPVIANVDARPYGPDDVRDKLCRQIASPVRWTDSIRYLMGQGELAVRELGPGTVLTKLVAKIQAEAEALTPEPALEPEPVPEPKPASTSGPALVTPPRALVTRPSVRGGAFLADHDVRYPYVAGGLYRGISSVQFVSRMARAGFLAFYGSAGLDADRIAADVRALAEQVTEPFGVNLTYDPFAASTERQIVDILLAADVRSLEVSTYVHVTPEVVRYRLSGARLGAGGRGLPRRRLLAKVTRPDIARLFLQPPPRSIVDGLLADGLINADEAVAAERLSLADDVCVVGDAGGYTDMGVLATQLPAMLRLRDEIALEHPAATPARIGAGGGIGTPAAAAAAFLLGASFVLTGSVNLCTAESALSAVTKDMLQQLDVHDTAYAPEGPLFELGGRAQVVKRGTLFHARANRLYDLWRNHADWTQIDPAVRAQVEQRYFQASFDEMYAAACASSGRTDHDPKRRMAVVFRWYCDTALRLAVEGVPGREVDYQLGCGPALGAANQWLRGTDAEHWRDRHVDEVGRSIVSGAEEILRHAGQSSARPFDRGGVTALL